MELRFGLIGAGQIATRFAGVLPDAPGARAAAITDQDGRRAAALAEKARIPRIYGSVGELLDDSQVDAVYIAVPHPFHVPLARRAIERGKAVLCEKPMAMGERDAAELAELAQKRDVLLMEGMWTRCLPAYRKAKEWVDSGAIGEVKLIHSSFCSRAPYRPESRLFSRELGGGALLDVGVYSLEFATGLLGEPVACTGSAVLTPERVDATSGVCLSFAGGAMAVSTASIVVDAPADAVVYGTRGRIELPEFYRAKSCVRSAEGREERFETEFSDGFLFEIEHFRQLFGSGRTQSDWIPLADTVACARLFDQLRRSWEK